jgi:hypothetical protein
MRSRPKSPQLANADFIDTVGKAIRAATSDIVQAELPEDIRRLLQRLERSEQKQARTDRDDTSKE